MAQAAVVQREHVGAAAGYGVHGPLVSRAVRRCACGGDLGSVPGRAGCADHGGLSPGRGCGRAAAGCRVIQVEEPTLHFMARYSPEQKEFIDFLVDAFNHEISGLENVEVWIHTCWGNPNMQKVFKDESYANSIEIYLERLKGDVWTIEASENNFKELPLFKPFKDRLKKKIAVGVISHRTLQADFPDVVAQRVRRCLEFIPADKLVLS